MGDSAKLYSFLNELGGVKVHTFGDRKVLQKTIYLLQELGSDLGYHFKWYIHGPYSSELTEDAFMLLQQEMIAPQTIRKYSLTPEDRATLDGFRHLLAVKYLLKDIAESGYWLELLSSLHFLWKVHLDGDRTKKTIINNLKIQKPGKFAEVDMNIAWNLLEKYTLISRAHDTKQ